MKYELTKIQSRYDVVMQENVPDGFKVVQVKATDTDPGNFGVVKYMLEPEAPRFNIDETSVSLPGVALLS